MDSSGNIYVTGSTKSGLDGNSNIAGYSWDFFLVKYNSSGVKQWTKQFGTNGSDFGFGVTVDSSDNLYVTGKTNYYMDNNTYPAFGGYDTFLVKFYDNGTKQWTQQLGTDTDDQGEGVTVDSSDNIYVIGNTSGGLDNNTNSGGWDFFLVKYNSSGEKQWTQQLGTSSNDTAKGVVVDSSNNIYVTGITSGGLAVPFTTGGPDGHTYTGTQQDPDGRSYDMFLVKYNSLGEKQWGQQLGGGYFSSGGFNPYGNDGGEGVTVDSSNNIYVTGS